MSIDTNSECVQICDAIVDVLNAGEFSRDFTAARFYSVADALANVTALVIAIFPVSILRKRISRGGPKQRDYGISLAVIQKVDPLSLDGPDELMLLTEELAEFVEDTPLATCRQASHTETEILTPVSPPHLRDDGVYLSAVNFTFVVLR